MANKKRFPTIYHKIKYFAQKYPNRVALETPARILITFKKLSTYIDNIILEMRHYHISKDDVILIVLPQGLEMVVALITAMTKAICVPLRPEYKYGEFCFYLSDLKPKLIITKHSASKTINRVANINNVPILNLRLNKKNGLTVNHSLILKTKKSKNLRINSKPNDATLMLYTSGTTSRPKKVALTHGNIIASAINIKNALKLTNKDTYLNLMPLFHLHGIITTISSIYSGGKTICAPKFNDNLFYFWLDQLSPTYFSATSTIHMAILNKAQKNRSIIAKNKLRFIRSASSSLPSYVLRKLENTFKVPVIESYSMTEAGQITSNPLPPRKRKPGSVGLPCGLELTIIDENKKKLSSSNIGEIAIKGKNAIKKYKNCKEANKVSFFDGWFRTGDLGHLDKDGYLFIDGRIKEIINRGGEKILPKEIDEILLKHPNVKQAVVFSIPHINLGEDVAAVVVLDKGKNTTEQTLIKFLRKKIADYKIPSRVLIVDEIPKSATGKINRMELYKKLENLIKEKYIKPRNRIETALEKIWRDVLNIKRIGVEDNFFMIGGSSLNTVELINKINDYFSVDVPLSIFLENLTISKLALYIKKTKKSKNYNIPSVKADTKNKYQPFPLTDIQQAYLFGRSNLSELGNISASSFYEFEIKNLNIKSLNLAINKLIRRHDTLRIIVLPKWKQQILNKVQLYKANIFDLRNREFRLENLELNRIRNDINHQVASINKWPLFNINVVLLKNNIARILIYFNLIITDSLSAKIFLSELWQLYANPKLNLPPHKISFRDYVLAEINTKKLDIYKKSKKYWLKKIKKLYPAPMLPLKNDPSSIKNLSFKRLEKKLDKIVWHKIKEKAARIGVFPTSIILTVFIEIIAHWSKQTRFTLNLPISNRSPIHNQINNIMGNFTTILLLEIDNSQNLNFKDKAKLIQKELLNNLKYHHFNGIEVTRKLIKNTGSLSKAVMPVVFTSGLGNNKSSSAPKSYVEYGIIRTPNIWLDSQIREIENDIYIIWDYVEQIFSKQEVKKMFQMYYSMIKNLAYNSDSWEK